MNIKNAIKSAFENYQAGNLQQAVHICQKIVKIHPDNINAINLLGIISYQQKDYDATIKNQKKLITLTQNNAQAYYILGHSMQEKGAIDEAILHYQKSLQLNPNFADAYYNLGTIFQDKKRYDEAISCYQKSLQFNPTDISAIFNIGLSLQEKRQFDEAITYYQKALQINPRLDEAYGRIGLALQEKEQIDEAIRFHMKAIELNPKNLIALLGLGTTLEEKGLFDEAITYYKKVLELIPNHIASLNNLGNCLKDNGSIDEAIDCYQKAIQLQPNHEQSFFNLAYAFQEKGQIDDAIVCFKKVIQINPDHTEAFILLTNGMQQTCNWQEFKALTPKLDRLTRKALDTGKKSPEGPFMSFTRTVDPSINFAIAKSWSRDIEKAMSNRKIHFSFDDRKMHKTKIVIGYLSNRFGNTATAHLMLSLFGLHNRDEFSINCYSYGKDDGSYYRARIEQDSDKFVDISSLSDEASARCINEDQVDILVDLKGYTKNNRLAIFALRPAPIQLSYLGFVCTTGADFIDYFITDKIVTPEDHSPYYSEKLIYMPHCYLVNDHTQSISNKNWEKVDFGMPESCFVFCSFNQPYKIDPIIFDVWMKILQQVPESVLWLLYGNKTAEENLRRQAETRGVKSDRIIFSKSLPKDEHLARLKLADLALDTRTVNGHTTTSDALWAGVPVVTLQGSHFASRVSSSILSALKVPELITYSTEEYEALAVQLAINTFKLKEIRQKIALNRIVEPLFDTPRFVRNLETAYKEMWKIFLAGEAPQQIEISES